jgi:hypothetical protein
MTVGQVLPLWIRTSTLVRIVVTAAWAAGKPAASALLGHGVEVVIAPKARHRPGGAGPPHYRPAAAPGPTHSLRVAPAAALWGATEPCCCAYLSADTAAGLGLTPAPVAFRRRRPAVAGVQFAAADIWCA